MADVARGESGKLLPRAAAPRSRSRRRARRPAQWVAPSLEHKLEALQHTGDRARFMQVLHDYEFEAAGFGLQLLDERGVTGQDQWYATSSTPTGAMSSATTGPTSSRRGTNAWSAAAL